MKPQPFGTAENGRSASYALHCSMHVLTSCSETYCQSPRLVRDVLDDKEGGGRTCIVALDVAARVAPLVGDSEVDGVR